MRGADRTRRSIVRRRRWSWEVITTVIAITFDRIAEYWPLRPVCQRQGCHRRPGVATTRTRTGPTLQTDG